MKKINSEEKLLLTTKEACQMAGVCYNTMHKILEKPSCTFLKNSV